MAKQIRKRTPATPGRPRKLADAPRLPGERWEFFCIEYLRDYNGTAAAIRAGVPPKGAHVTACRMLKQAKVISRIAELSKATLDNKLLNINRLVAEAEALAYADAGKMLVKVGDRFEFKPLDEIDTRAVSEIRMETTTVTRKDSEPEARQTMILKLHNKPAAIEMLLKRFGELQDRTKVEISGPGGGPVEVESESIRALVRASMPK